MKKMILPALSLVLALSLSAFTVVHKQAERPVLTQQLYWFFVDDQISQTPDSYDGNGLQEKPDEMSITGCDELVTTHCRYGYTADQLNFDGNGNPVSVKEVSPGVPQAPAEIIRKHSN